MPRAPLISISEAAGELGIGEAELRGLVQRREIAAINVGASARPSWRFDREDIDAFRAPPKRVPIAPLAMTGPVYSQKTRYAVRKDSVVYFFRSGPFIKIGTTTKLKHRLQNVQTSHPTPIALVGSTPGDKRLERELHRRFAHLRVNGEWFREVDDLAVYVTNLGAE